MSRTACLNAVYELAKKDERVVFIGSDLAPNTLADFKRDFPKRYFMDGISEQNIIGMAAGLAKEGLIPYVNTIATFITRRCYEQIAVDIAMHNLNVRLIGNGGGLLYAPLGPTHCAIEDIAIMRALPNMSVVCCSDSEEMKEFMPTTLEHQGPMYIRLGKDADAIVNYRNGDASQKFYGAPYPRWVTHCSDPSILFVSTGVMTSRVCEAIKLLERNAISSECLHYPYIKPFHYDGMKFFIGNRDASTIKLVVTVEEGIRNGGFGSAALEAMSDNGVYLPMLRLGLPDAFPHHYGEQDDLLHTYGLQPEQIAQRVKEAYGRL